MMASVKTQMRYESDEGLAFYLHDFFTGDSR
jgi:hypothetical protein